MKNLIILLITFYLLAACKKAPQPYTHGHGDTTDQNADPHAGHDHAQGSSVDLSPQAIKNMGVYLERAQKSDYTVYTPVPAVIRSTPLNEQPVFAPYQGRVRDIRVTLGKHSKSSEILLSLFRAPIPRTELHMVDEILKPASEEYHSTVADLRRNIKALEVLDKELSRLKSFQKDNDGISVVPQKDLIDLKYEKAKITQEIENFQTKLTLHGLTKKEIALISNGKTINRSPRFWLNALKQNNIWTKMSETLINSLPKNLQNNRWAIATIGELSAEELISQEFINWLKDQPKAAKNFLEIARLLQDGHSLTDIQNLYELGALEEIISIKAPLVENDWDVQKIHVKPGQLVQAGEALITLSNYNSMYLQATPQGSEIINLNTAAKNKSLIKAVPLVPESAITLEKLRISKIIGKNSGNSIVYIPVENSIQNNTVIAGTNYRNWNLRNGLKYVLQIPKRIITGVIVLPADAVLQHGPDKVVFVKVKGEFVRRKVVVAYHNNEVAVVSSGSELKERDAVVTKGAFALHLALIAGTPEAVDPHAGHSH